MNRILLLLHDPPAAIYNHMLPGIMAAYSTYSSSCAWGL